RFLVVDGFDRGLDEEPHVGRGRTGGSRQGVDERRALQVGVRCVGDEGPIPVQPDLRERLRAGGQRRDRGYLLGVSLRNSRGGGYRGEVRVLLQQEVGRDTQVDAPCTWRARELVGEQLCNR